MFLRPLARTFGEWIDPAYSSISTLMKMGPVVLTGPLFGAGFAVQILDPLHLAKDLVDQLKYVVKNPEAVTKWITAMKTFEFKLPMRN